MMKTQREPRELYVPNTFKPFFKRWNLDSGPHNYLGLYFSVCNKICLTMHVCGKGFTTGVWLYNVHKGEKK